MTKKNLLFYSFMIIFIITAVITLLGVTGKIFIKERFLWPLFSAFLIQIVTAVIKIFKSNFNTLPETEVVNTDKNTLNIDMKIKPDNTKLSFSPPQNNHEVVFRRTTERAGGDELLQNANEAIFLGLTFKTLGEALKNGLKNINKLERAYILIYSLPILKDWHPTLQGEGQKLKREWKNGLEDTLSGLILQAPNLKELTVGVISEEPVFTASIVSGDISGQRQTRIRYTPIVRAHELTESPTYVTTCIDGKKTELYNYYQKIIERFTSNWNLNSYKINLKKRNNNWAPLINQLSSICHNKRYTSNDLFFKVSLNLQSTICDALKFNFDYQTSITPDTVKKVYEYCRDNSDFFNFTAKYDFTNQKVVLCANSKEGNTDSCINLEVKQKHLCAFFLLPYFYEGNDAMIVLRKLNKAGWDYDVIGGKVSVEDNNMFDVLKRETFEETGSIIDRSRISEKIYFKYDPQSSVDHAPVVVAYSTYESVNSDEFLTDTIIKHKTAECSIDIHSMPQLITYSRNELIQDKKSHLRTGFNPDKKYEAKCHATLEAISGIKTNNN